jgi:hypothetical protein
VAKFVSKYLADAVLSWVKGTTFPAAPANVYLAIMTTAPTARDGTGGVECTGTGYARQAVASSAWGAIATSGSGLTALEQILNSNTVSWGAAGGSNWGTAVGIGVYDALTNGNLIDYGDLTASQAIGSGQTFQIGAGSLALQA